MTAATRPRSLRSIRLPAGPLLAVLETRARRDGALTLPAWVRWHPHAAPSDVRALFRAQQRGTVAAPIADRWAIRLAGLTLDEIYGPDWDEVAA